MKEHDSRIALAMIAPLNTYTVNREKMIRDIIQVSTRTSWLLGIMGRHWHAYELRNSIVLLLSHFVSVMNLVRCSMGHFAVYLTSCPTRSSMKSGRAKTPARPSEQ